MWWKLAGLALLEGIAIWWLVRPIPTHAVVYNLTRDGPLPPPDHGMLFLEISIWTAMLAIIGVPVLAFWIYRRANK